MDFHPLSILMLNVLISGLPFLFHSRIFSSSQAAQGESGRISRSVKFCKIRCAKSKLLLIPSKVCFHSIFLFVNRSTTECMKYCNIE